MGFVLTVCHVLIVFVVPLPIVISLTSYFSCHYTCDWFIHLFSLCLSCVVLCLTVVVWTRYASLVNNFQFSRVLSCCGFLGSMFSLVFTVCLLICLLFASHFSSSMFLSWRSRSCVLWLLHPCPSLHAQERSFPLWLSRFLTQLHQHWRWDAVRCSLPTLTLHLHRHLDCGRWSPYALPSLPRGVTEGLIGLIPSSCLHSLPWIMASGPLSRSSFVFWDFNKYLSWTCNWIRVFPWQNSQTRNRFSRSTHSQDRCDTTGHSPWPAFHPVNSHLKGSWPTDSPGSWT